MSKTNAIRILEARGVRFSLHEYVVSEDDLSAETVAAKIHAPLDQVFKTLVTRGDKTGVCVFVIPSSMELDLRKAASLSANKRVEMIKEKELLPLTGYVRGGCSPIGMKKKYPVYVDESSSLFEEIYCSAGVRGIQIKIRPSDLIETIDAIEGDVT